VLKGAETSLLKKYLLFVFVTFLLACPSFSPALLSSGAADEPIPCVWQGVEKIIAVGDIHGDYQNFVKILKGVGLVDEDLHWNAGKTHFVQTGDIMNRGPDAKNALDLVQKLEGEAEAAGGKVHFLLGNHEEMNITGIALTQVGYVTIEQFISFLPEKFRQRKEREFREQIQKKTSTGEEGEDADLKKYWQEAMKTDPRCQNAYIEGFNTTYGKWIIEHNAVIKINDTVFAHGGISEHFSQRKLEDINNQLRFELEMIQTAAVRNRPLPPSFRAQIVYRSDGPLWYRDLAVREEEDIREEVDRILSNLGAQHMVIAHTRRAESLVSLEYMQRLDGKIWIIDSGIADLYGGNLSALIIAEGKFTAWGENDEN
jgi:hypothetical protein